MPVYCLFFQSTFAFLMTEKKREEKNIVRMLYVYVDKIEFEKEKKKKVPMYNTKKRSCYCLLVSVCVFDRFLLDLVYLVGVKFGRLD